MVIDLTDKIIHLTATGDADTLDGVDAEKQIIRNSLLIFKGSWLEDDTVGPDWLAILGKRFSIGQIKAEIRRVLTELDEVTKIIIVSLGTVDNTRSNVLTFVVTTVSGNTVRISEDII